jgi:acyl-CoA reductase-like NAD-dependent aldehyde dehydrogenase
MRKLAMVALAVMCLGGTASVSAAQGGGGGGRGRGSMIDRVLQQPTAITLTADQQKKVDSLKAAMTDEQTKARDAAGDDRQAMMAAMAPITKKYMDAVRALLTADQQKTWDENVAAQPQRGRRGGGGGGGI